jgi:predicted homoserine dehydrogenase-like protein
MNFHDRYVGPREPVETCLIGSGAFGRSFLAQARRMRLMRARIAIDLDANAAGAALAASGLDRRDIAICHNAAEARVAWDRGRAVAAASLETVFDLPFSVLVEATGSPEAATRHAMLAIEAGRHVALVSKEADSVVGPGLARTALDRGVIVTPVDGDQPSLLIGLITWAEVLGLEVMAAGKSSEYDFVLDLSSGDVTSNGVTQRLSDLPALWTPGPGSAADRAAARADVLGRAFPLRTVPDLCEMTLVANAVGLQPDVAAFHAPPARIPELADLFAQRSHGGLLTGGRRVDVFHHLRLADEASFAGGVFVVVRWDDSDTETWAMLAEKGHVVSREAGTAMLYLPRHLLGVEAATSVLDAAILGLSGYGADYRPHQDLVAVATRDLPDGTRLTMGGHHHSIDGVGAEMRPAAPLANHRPAPFYLVADRVLTRAVRAGDPIRFGDVAVPDASDLLQARQRQDALFASGTAAAETGPARQRQ